MKRTILSLAILSCIGFAQAEYFIKVPLDVTFIKKAEQTPNPENPESPSNPEVDCETQTEECAPELAGWEKFATDNNLAFSNDWNSLAWASKGLTAVPTEVYPIGNPNGIALQENQLTSVSGLKSVNSVGTHLYLHSNALTDISGLSNLQSVGSDLYLSSNNLNNVNPLNNLNYVGGSIYLYGNPLSDASGLINTEVMSSIRIDNSYNGTKLAFDTIFCTLNPAHRFPAGYAQKSQVCEDGLDSWENFAFNKDLTYGTNWNSLAWNSKSLTFVPTELFPNSNPTGEINLSANSLTNVNGLRNVTTVGALNIYSNKLENIDALSKLTTVNGNLQAGSNLLTNVDGLINVNKVNGELYLNNNNITDITGLSNMVVSLGVAIDSTYNGPKMAVNSSFCTLNKADQFSVGYAQKSQVCEDELVSWEKFATDNNLGFYPDWETLAWGSKFLTSIPTELYPISNPKFTINLENNSIQNVDGLASIENIGIPNQLYSGHLFFNRNKLENIDGLRNLKSVGGTLDLGSNQLKDVSGLSNLTFVGKLSLYGNKLENLDGLSKLTAINGDLQAYSNLLTNVNGLRNVTKVSGQLRLNNNNLKDVNGLSNITEVNGLLNLFTNNITDITGLSKMVVSSPYLIMIDSTYNGPKMAADSRFCTFNKDSQFNPSFPQYAKKSQVCEI